MTEVAPLVKEGYVFDENKKISDIYKTFGSSFRALNGTGLLANNLVKAIETLTWHDHLHLLTLLNFAEVFSQQYLLRDSKAWCPICYEEWRSTEQTIYEPLIWSFNAVTICEHHLHYLITQCPHCHKKNICLSWHSRTGYCSLCKKWLGEIAESSSILSLSSSDLDWQLWVIKNLSELITVASTSFIKFKRSNIQEVFTIFIERCAEGNIRAFADFLSIKKRTVSQWYKGHYIPILSTLLEVGLKLSVSLIDFLSVNVNPQTFDCLSTIGSMNKNTPRATQSQIKSSTHQKKQAKIRHSYEREQIEKVLLSEINSDEYPPPSFKKVARRLGISLTSLRTWFPSLCHQISAKYVICRHTVAIENAEKIRQQVRQAAFELHAKGIKPNSHNVSKLLPKAGLMKDKKAITAFNEVLIELGY